MRSNRVPVFLTILTLAVFAVTTNGHAGSGGGGGMGAGNATGGHSFDLSSGGASGMSLAHVGGLGTTPSLSSEIATPGKSHLGTAETLAPLPEIDAPSTTLGHAGGMGHDDMATLGKGVALSHGRGIQAIDPDLDMTKIGGDMSGRSSLHYGEVTIDRLDRDLEKFDPQQVSNAQSKDRHPATRNGSGDRRGLTDRQRAALAKQLAPSNSVPTTIGSSTPIANTPFSLAPSIPSTTSPVTVSPDASLSTALPPSQMAVQTTANQIEDTSAPLSASDLSSLRTLFFPSGGPAAALTSSQSPLGVGLSVGSTLSRDIAIDPLPDIALSSADSANLGYVYDGQTIVIADYNTREVVAVLSGSG